MDRSINTLIRNLSAALLVGSLSICASADNFTNDFSSQIQSGYSQVKPDTTEEAKQYAAKKRKKKGKAKKRKPKGFFSKSCKQTNSCFD
ncbi:MAG TPA: hypothetical protein QF353_00565 [Gammaproteobacteria bacterium]|nr:hypothetical protein [Gammaproteobacteria bacterium]